MVTEAQPTVELDNPDTMSKLERLNRDEVMIEPTPEEKKFEEMFRTEMPERVVPPIMQQIRGTPAQAPGPDIGSVMRNARKE